MKTVEDAYGTYTFSYRSFAIDFFGVTQYGRGRLESIHLAADTDTLDATVSYEYDALGRVIKRQIDGVANESTWAYDAAGRLSLWTNSLGTFTPTYVNSSYGVSRLDSVDYPNGQVIDYEWEDKTGDFRLKTIENLGSGSTALSKFEYVTDAISRIKTWKQQKGAAAMERFDFGYNGTDELTSAVLKTDSSGAILKQYYYSYDAAGNRTSEQVDNMVKSSTFNALNQLTSQAAGGPTRFQGTLNEPGTVTVAGQAAWMWGGTNFQANATLTTGTNLVAVVSKDVNNNTRTNTFRVVVPSGASATLTYDAAGNMTNDGSKSYNWDAWGRLVKVTYAGGASSEFGYDAFGRRVKIVEKNSVGAVTSAKQFVWEGLEIAEERDNSNVPTKRYFNEGWRDVTGSANYYTTKDHLGSVRDVLNNSGALVSRYDYDPYGRTTKVLGSVDSDMLYTGHYFHTASGLYLALYRAYDPNLARWLSRDPIGEAGGDNLYAYVANNPVNDVDPLGLINWSTIGSAFEGKIGVGLGLQAKVQVSKLKVSTGARYTLGSWGNLGGQVGNYIAAEADLIKISAGEHQLGLGAAYNLKTQMDSDPDSCPTFTEKSGGVAGYKYGGVGSKSNDWFKVGASAKLGVVDLGVSVNFGTIWQGLWE